MNRERPVQTLLYVAFYVALWLTILYGFVGAVLNIMAADDIFKTWGPFAARVFLAPFGLSAMQLMWWLTVYRPYGLEGRPIMVMMGILFLIVLLIAWLKEDLYGLSPGYFHYPLFWFAAVTHLGYGLFGRE